MKADFSKRVVAGVGGGALVLVAAFLTAAVAGGRLDAGPVGSTKPSALPLVRVRDVPVTPADPSLARRSPRMDYESIDPVARRLYVAYLGADEVLVYDLRSDTVVAHIRGLHRVHGTLAIPSLHRLYASATGTDEVAAVDERTLTVIARAPGGDYPDGIAYDPANRAIFVSDEHGSTDTVIDVVTNRRVATLDLGGEAGNTQYDPKRGRIFTDVQTRDDVVEIDPMRRAVVARHPLAGCDHDHGLALDVEHRLAFVACDGNATLVLVDLDSWRELGHYPVGDEPDVLAFDAGLRRLYVAAESGVVAVFDEDGRSLRPHGLGYLAEEAHTVAADPVTHRVYFALQSVGGHPAIRVMAPADADP